LGTIEDLERIIKENNIDKIIITIDELDEYELDTLINFKVNGIDMITYKEFNEQIEQKIDITYIDKKWLLESMGFEILHNTTQQKIKRLSDIIFSVILLIVTFPIILITGIIIKMSSKGPVFFRQKRLGLKNMEFEIIKFRSMKIHDQNEFSKYADENDPRVTRFGKFIRKTRIDELPQLICILKGDMSFVGPRPEWNELCYGYMKNIPYYNLRHLIKPGVTGWAQVMYPYGISTEDAYRKLEYDLYYMKHQDVMMDLKIVFRTVKIVIFAKGL
jgi:exopolysaccharide biosynthesis polyprenyl glycosylphosphotransferase